ncbi:MAG: phosphatidylserine decarboxylase [Kurthia sp.]|nr:phosphatidylserine decarboxylase [Candidatus Kurthia equi]
MKKKLYQSAVELTNKRWSSYLIKTIMNAKYSKYFIKSYIDLYKIDTKEVSKKMNTFPSMQQFFTRELKSDARPIDGRYEVITSPADSKIESFGPITDDTSIIVKGQTYRLEDILGKKENAQHYKNGQYIVFYLSPADYHRVHSPVDAYVKRQYILGGNSYPVNKSGLKYGKKPISGNYRMVSELELENGHQVGFIKVGAMLVNSIHLTNTSDTWIKGEDIGYFAFGSTVVMLFEEDSVQFLSNVQQGEHIEVGEAFCNML